MDNLKPDPSSAGALDGTVMVRVVEGGMAAQITVTSPGSAGRPVTEEEVLEKLREAGVVYGIDHVAVLMAIALPPAPAQGPAGPVTHVVAVGRQPVNGDDARIEYKAPLTAASGRPRMRDDGSVDLFDLGMVHNVEKGTVLATRIPPTLPESGMSVLGVAIPGKPGHDTPLRVGNGAILSDDRCTVLAEVDGHATMVQGKIRVTPIFRVDGDVGPATGNILFVGSVVVRGNVNTGYSVKAEGDVDIFGGVDGGVVEATGRVSVRYGIQGAGRGRVIAGGAVKARFIENAEVRGGAEVWVADGILHSRVEAGARVEVMGRRGAIVGGRVSAREGVSARFLGAGTGTPTEIAVGIAPQIRAEIDGIIRQLNEIDNNLRRTQQAVRLFKDTEEKRGPLPQEKKEMLVKLLRGQYHLVARREELLARREELQELLGDPRTAWVRALDVCYPGVRILIGSSPYVVTDLLQRTSFYLNEQHEVQIGRI